MNVQCDHVSEVVAFYDAAAPSFDSSYARSRSNLPEDLKYNYERQVVEQAISGFGAGALLDLGAGTGYWLTAYIDNVESVTLVEPSSPMRAEIRCRLRKLSLATPIAVKDGTHGSLPCEPCYDSALVSGVLGHYPPASRKAILDRVVKSLRVGGQLMLTDSMWNMQAAKRHPDRVGYATRHVRGQSRKIFKHYFTEQEVTNCISHERLHVEEVEVGVYFWVARLIKASRSC